MTNATQPDAVVRRFLQEAKVKGLSDNTIKNVTNTLSRLSRWAHTNSRPPVLYLTTDDLLAWSVELSAEILPQTLHGYLVQLRMFYGWALTREILDIDPTVGIDLPRLPDRLPDPMPEEIFKQVMVAAEPDMAAILGLAGFSGFRACEIAWLSWPGVRFADNRLRVTGKGNRERVVPMCQPLRELLEALPGRKGPVIPRRDGGRGHNEPHCISHRASRHLKATGCEQWTLHKLRHRFGTLALAGTGDLLAVAELMGHRNPATTQIYARVSPEHLQAAADAAGKFVA